MRKTALLLFLFYTTHLLSSLHSSSPSPLGRLGGAFPSQISDFQWKATPIPDDVWQRMQGVSIPKDCSVKRSELRYLKILHVTTDGSTKTGEMICNKSIANDLIDIFRELYKARYVIERIELIDNYGASDAKSMEANNTSCFCYRMMTGSKNKISKHGLGLAIDINPLYNPYVKPANGGDTPSTKVEPKTGRKYAFNRSKRKDIPMKIDRNDLCYKLFIKHGFRWGGDFRYNRDYQHFEK